MAANNECGTASIHDMDVEGGADSGGDIVAVGLAADKPLFFIKVREWRLVSRTPFPLPFLLDLCPVKAVLISAFDPRPTTTTRPTSNPP